MMKETYTYIGPFKELATLAGLPIRGALKDEQLNPSVNQGILIKNDRIEKIANHELLLTEAKRLEAEITILEGDFCVLPGFIDSHTHICFAGNRATDYAMRNAGKSYLEIANAGGGIQDTVTATRNASEEVLTQNVITRANHLLSKGITTIEVKSGYGLSIVEELKMLRAIQKAQKHTAATLIPTCLAAHTLPKEYKNKPEQYIDLISQELLPQLKEENLTNRVDAFIEQSAFTSKTIIPYFDKAVELGMDITVHADQFTAGGSAVAVEYNAVSADHLEASGTAEIQLLAQSNTVATALPGASLGLGCAFTPARKLLDAGAIVAIASDWNPGSAPMGDLLTQAAILGTFQKLSNAEILAGMTTRAAKALNLKHSVSLETNNPADLVIFKTDQVANILYHQGQLQPDRVYKNGKLAFKTSAYEL